MRVGLFRSALGLYLIYYYISLLPHFFSYFGPESLFRPNLYPWTQPSLLFTFWNSQSIIILLITLVILIVLFTIGFYPKACLIPLWVIHISFHNANPLIIHEPQQIANLLLIFCFFLPLHHPPILWRSHKNKGLLEETSNDKQVIHLLIIYLGIYYLFAGLKKLPDPLWIDGVAFQQLLQWPALGKVNFLTDIIIRSDLIAKICDYTALLFEVSFILLVWTRLRPWLFLLGVAFQISIHWVLEVGSFPWIMIVWQTLLLDRRTQDRLRSILPSWKQNSISIKEVS